jgi:phage tail-like protein
MANESYPLSAFNFLVNVIIKDAKSLDLKQALCDAEFAECDGLEMTMEPKTIREGGNNTQQIHLVGPVSYGNLTLKRGMTTTLDLWRWFTLATGNQKRSLRATTIVTMQNAKHEPQLKFTLLDCLPLKIKAPALNAKDGVVAIEEMQITYGSFSVEQA